VNLTPGPSPEIKQSTSPLAPLLKERGEVFSAKRGRPGGGCGGDE